MNDFPIEWVPVPYRLEVAEHSFLVSRFPVTVGQFRRFLEADGYTRRELWSDDGWRWRSHTGFDAPAYWGKPGYEEPKFPVTGVSFWEAEAYAHFSDASLPTEEEWLTCCSNHETTKYPWGNAFDDEVAPRANLNFFGALGQRGLRAVDAFPAGRLKLGVWDLLGNVSEWCSTARFEDTLTGVLRGGCFWHTPVAVDAHFWDAVNRNTRDNQTGIRLVRRPAHTAASAGEVGLHGGAPPVTAPAAGPAPSVVGKRLHRRIGRPSAPFRQEGLPETLTRDAWRLRVGGAVSAPLELSMDSILRDFPRSELSGMFVCVCRWGDLNHFAGVSLRDFVERVNPTAPLERLYLNQRSVVGSTGKSYESWISVAEAIANDAILAYEMDGEPLSMDLGWPLRLIALHLFAYKAVKCLGELRFTTDVAQGWWETECQYDVTGIVQPGVITVVGERPYRRTLEAPGRVSLTEEERAFLSASKGPSR